MAEQPKYIYQDGKLVPNPAYQEDYMNEDMREDMDDLLSMDNEDKAWAFGTGGIGDVGGEEDLSDLFEVSEADIIGDDEPQKPRYRINPNRI